MHSAGVKTCQSMHEHDFGSHRGGFVTLHCELKARHKESHRSDGVTWPKGQLKPIRTKRETLLETIVQGRKRFNGKPFSHWQTLADELAVELMIRAALQHTDDTSIIGYLARRRLLEIARTENRSVYDRMLKSRETCLRGFTLIMQSILPRKTPS